MNAILGASIDAYVALLIDHSGEIIRHFPELLVVVRKKLFVMRMDFQERGASREVISRLDEFIHTLDVEIAKRLSPGNGRH